VVVGGQTVTYGQVAVSCPVSMDKSLACCVCRFAGEVDVIATFDYYDDARELLFLFRPCYSLLSRHPPPTSHVGDIFFESSLFQ